MVADLFRDSTVGQIVNYVSNGRLLPYPEQRRGYVVPKHYLLPAQLSDSLNGTPVASDAATLCDPKTPNTHLKRESTLVEDLEKNIIDEKTIPDPYLVDWEGDSDPENPRNWTFKKRAFTAFCISFLTFSIYIGSAIYTSSIPGLMVEYNVSLTKATLGLTLYVVGYGLGPMFLSPLQELPLLGRNPVYMAGLLLFVIFQIPIVKATNMNTVLAMRFFTGFFGSPALATGGASMADIFPGSQLAYVLGVWALGAVAGPITGPVIGGFAAQAKSWRWPMMELIWITSFAVVFLSIFLPETYEPTILLRRAERLRKLTGNRNIRTAAEREQESKKATDIAYEALIRPVILSKEPALAFASIYLGFVYGLFYLWFEAFPLVFTDIYHFNLGVSSLPFLGFIVTGTLTYTVYCLYQKYHIAPRVDRIEAANLKVAPEIRLEIGLMASIFIPASILIFGFASRSTVHWIVPVIGASLYLPGIFLVFQSILMYVSTAYEDHAASVLAGNDLFRSTIASVFPLFGRAFFVNLGLGPGSALLAGISFVLMPVYWLLLKYGHVLRQRSKYASTP
ncbi:Benomyl methotrexate resistance protein [Mycena indigotica]|uniref:Benomyl methotrexate resistance protein n=1 Tax=Mycena indigotica TaxID=2126181 RepID=A0A8H6SDT1_9AGAR|nr:Benomyl methotrexate resistance protein [Mycena indigotica]KAF7297113.1 Benomyl methotrexate resistance protein [Mycena indigotica]